jgi:MoaE-MoaD fusion protein
VDISVRLFASLREYAGAGTLKLDLPDGATVDDAIADLRTGPLRGLPEAAQFVAAVGREYSKRDRVLADGDELALVPPVSGGAPDPVRLAEVTGQDLDVDAVRRLVGDPGAGGTVVFIGTTRDVPSLEYEAYADMARDQIALLAAAAAADHRNGRARRAEHRRRGVGRPPRSGLRRGPPVARRGQGAGADLEARAPRGRSAGVGRRNSAERISLDFGARCGRRRPA